MNLSLNRRLKLMQISTVVLIFESKVSEDLRHGAYYPVAPRLTANSHGMMTLPLFVRKFGVCYENLVLLMSLCLPHQSVS